MSLSDKLPKPPDSFRPVHDFKRHMRWYQIYGDKLPPGMDTLRLWCLEIKRLGRWCFWWSIFIALLLLFVSFWGVVIVVLILIVQQVI